MCFRKKQKKVKQPKATSMADGIIFYSNRHKNCYCETTIDENGQITSKWIDNQDKEKKSPKEIFLDIWNAFLPLLKALPFAIILYFIFYQLIQDNFMIFMRIVFLILALKQFIPFFVNVSKDRKQEKNNFRIHAAVHMGLNAFKKINRPPTLEEIRDYSRYYNNCNTTDIAFIGVYFLFLFFFTFIPSIIIILIATILELPLLMFLLIKGYFKFLQKFNTEPPTELELEAVVTGIKTWYDNEIKEDK